MRTAVVARLVLSFSNDFTYDVYSVRSVVSYRTYVELLYFAAIARIGVTNFS